jgi:hypothetical protein
VVCCHIDPRIVESDTMSLVHDLCGSGEFIYNKETTENTLSSFNLVIYIGMHQQSVPFHNVYVL